MTSRFLSVISIFVLAFIIGTNLLSTESVQAQAVPVAPLELSFVTAPVKQSVSVDTFNVSYDINTREVSVKGSADAIVNVTVTGEIKPVIKYRTIEKNTGYPYIKSMSKISDKPISPFNYEQSNN